MRNPIKKMQGGVTHVMIVACLSLAFAFMLLLISYAIITGLAGTQIYIVYRDFITTLIIGVLNFTITPIFTFSRASVSKIR